eukprot:2448605-Amphidinium_carterae.1
MPYLVNVPPFWVRIVPSFKNIGNMLPQTVGSPHCHPWTSMSTLEVFSCLVYTWSPSGVEPSLVLREKRLAVSTSSW